METIPEFCERINREYRVMPEYSFAHIVLGDGNISAGHIDYCLSDEVVNDYICRQMYDMPQMDAMNYASDNTRENWRYWEMVNAWQEIIEYLSKLRERAAE